MSAHEIHLKIIGKGLKKYKPEDVMKILNKGQKFDWIFLGPGEDEICISAKEIIVYSEAKGVNFKSITKSIAKNMPGAETVMYFMKPYWASIGPNGCDFDMFIWSKNRRLRKEIFRDGRMTVAEFKPNLWSWRDVMEEEFIENCKDEGTEYDELKDYCDPLFGENGDPDYAYAEYLSERYSGALWMLGDNMENELYESLDKKAHGVSDPEKFRMSLYQVN